MTRKIDDVKVIKEYFLKAGRRCNEFGDGVFRISRKSEASFGPKE
jgi:hypothetical protein